jgi:LacI family transcriptional regulator
LISLGHKNIACMTGPSQLSPSAQRAAGYKDALRAAGLPLNEDFLQPGDFRSKSGYRLCQFFLRGPNPPTALFVCNDLMAIGALCAAHEMAVKVPEELSIIGFDDIALASMTIPRLSTVSQPKQDIGKIVTKLLIERIQDRSLPTRKIVIQPELIIRNSCSRIR